MERGIAACLQPSLPRALEAAQGHPVGVKVCVFFLREGVVEGFQSRRRVVAGEGSVDTLGRAFPMKCCIIDLP